MDPAGSGFGGVVLSQNVAEPEEVARVLAGAVAAGGTLVRAAEEAAWGGRRGYFADPEGHLWEVAWNPRLPLDAGGRLVWPE